MRGSLGLCLLIYSLPLGASSRAADVCEVRLRAAHFCSGSLVRLGDVAEIRGGDEAEASMLAAMDLLPAPPAGVSRRLRAGEVRELLVLRGVDAARIRLSGAEAVTLYRASRGGSHPPAQPESRSAQARVERAILNHLQRRVSDYPWRVEASLEAAATALLSARLSDVSVEGGRAPWVGRQEFVIEVNTASGPTRIPVTAEVSLPELVVTAVRSLPRGEVIRQADLQLLPVATSGCNSEAFRRLEDVAGSETVRALAAGQPIGPGDVQRPRLVRRGEIVTLYSRAPGVQVRTSARAVQDGAGDDLIAVELASSRRRLVARVSGFQEVEVFARGPRVEAESPGGLSYPAAPRVANHRLQAPPAADAPGETRRKEQAP